MDSKSFWEKNRMWRLVLWEVWVCTTVFFKENFTRIHARKKTSKDWNQYTQSYERLGQRPIMFNTIISYLPASRTESRFDNNEKCMRWTYIHYIFTFLFWFIVGGIEQLYVHEYSSITFCIFVKFNRHYLLYTFNK